MVKIVFGLYSLILLNVNDVKMLQITGIKNSQNHIQFSIHQYGVLLSGFTTNLLYYHQNNGGFFLDKNFRLLFDKYTKYLLLLVKFKEWVTICIMDEVKENVTNVT